MQYSVSDPCTFEEALRVVASKEGFYIWTTSGNPLFAKLPENVDVQCVNTVIMFHGVGSYAQGITVEPHGMLWESVIISKNDDFSVEKFREEFPQLFEVSGSFYAWDPDSEKNS